MSNSLYGAVCEYQAPSGVTHALRGRFGPPGSSAWGIVFIKRSSIELYNIHANEAHARLDLVGVANVPTAVYSAAALRRPSVSADFLWTGFSAMRVAALAWDPAVRDWLTLQAIDLGAVINKQAANMLNESSSRDHQRAMSRMPDNEHRVLIRGRYSDHSSADVRVDDRGRCIAVLASSLNMLLVLPMRSDADLSAAAANPATVGGSEPLVSEADIFSIDLKDEFGVANIKDFVFLDDSFEPTVLLLYEPKRTWAGRLATERNTSELLAITLDLRSKTHAKAWSMQKMPFDADKLVVVPGSAGGGVLVFSPNVLMQVRHEACAAGLSLNSFGDFYAKEMESTYGAVVHSKTLLSLDAARCEFLDVNDSSTALLSLKGGELYFLTVAGKGRSGLTLVRAGSTVLASSIVPVNDRFFILASRVSDSLLVEFRRTAGDSGGDVTEGRPSDSPGGDATMADADAVANENAGGGEKEGGGGKKIGKRKTKKRRRTAEEEAEYEMLYGSKPPPESDSESDREEDNAANPLELEDKDEGTRGVYDDDDELGLVFNSADDDGRAGADSSREAWSLVVKDTLTSYGPSADVAIGKTPGEADGALDMVVAGGYAKNGCLGVLQHSVRPRDITRFELKGFSKAWTIRDPSLSRREAQAREQRNVKRAKKNEAIAARNAEQREARDKWVEEQVEALKNVSAAGDEVGHPNGESGKTGDMEKQLEAAGEEGGALDVKKEDEAAHEDVKQPPTKRVKVEEDPEKLDLDDMERIPRRAPDAKPPAESDANENANEGPISAGADKNIIAEKEAAINAEADVKFALEPEEALEDIVADVGDLHSYMLLTSDTSTVVMSTGEDLEEVPAGSVDFLTDTGTIAAGNVLGHAAIVQVHSRGVRLLRDARVAAEHTLPSGSPAVTFAQVADPFVSLLMANGSLIILKVQADCKVLEDVGAPGPANGSGLQPPVSAGTVEYSNLQLSVDCRLESPQAGNRISSAYVYKGSLGQHMKRKLVGDLSTGAGGEMAVDNGVKEDGTSLGISGAATGVPGASGAGSADNEMDEEERMLYGAGAAEDDEEERMLYGDSGAGGSGDEGKGAGTSGGDSGADASVLPSATQSGDVDMDDRVGVKGEKATLTKENGVFALQDGKKVQSREGNVREVPGVDDECPSLLVTATKDGALELRLMQGSDYPLVFRCALFFFGAELLVDDGCEPGQSTSGAEALDGSGPAQAKAIKAKKKDRITSLVLSHVTGTALVPGMCTPILVAVQASGFPLVYRAFVASDVPTGGLERSSARFSRVSSPRMTSSMLSVASSSAGRTPLVPFENVAGRGGVFIGGKRPFLVFAERGFPRMHPLRCTVADDGAATSGGDAPGITSFSELHNVNCPRGFVYVTSGGVVGVSELQTPANVNTDALFPFRKVSLRCTPHKVAYHAGSATYGVLASMPTLTTREERLARIIQSLEKHDKRHYESTVAQAEAETGDERLARVPPLYEELHELRVYKPDGWQLIKSFKLRKGEVGLAIANISVDVYKQRMPSPGVTIPSTNKADDGGETHFAASLKLRPKNMLVVGTGYLNGEDATSRGRLLMFEISRQEVFSEASGRYTAFQLQLIAEKELPGPVTAVAPMEGYVVAGVGPQLGVYKLVQDEIVHLSFAFGQLFCTSIASVKQYVVSADMYKSVSFHFFRNRNTSVNFLGKDYSHNMSYATEYLIDGAELGLVMSDGEGNIQLLDYAHARVPESRGGKRLLLNGGTNYGSRINKFQRVRIDGKRPSLVGEETTTNPKKQEEALAGPHATLFVTLDGGIGAVVPIGESHFKCIEKLGEVMIGAQEVARHAGLDPKDARAFRPSGSATQMLSQRMIDTRLALEALLLSPARVRAVCTMAGTTVDSLTDLCGYFDSILSRF